MQLSDFDYPLPQHLIAHAPLKQRDASRLLHVPASGGFADRQFTDLPQLLRADDVLVFNNTKVIPAQLYAVNAKGATIGITLLKQAEGAVWECFAKPARKLAMGDVLNFRDALQAELLEKNEAGTVMLRFDRSGDAFHQALEAIGNMPLPPYIKRDAGLEEEDRQRYQTIYAKQAGAVAAPTAGLHFTETLLNELRGRGIATHEVTLHVGGGTFLPVRHDDISQHQMHREWMVLSEQTANALNQAKAEGSRIIAVGTTSLRCLESCADAAGILHAKQEETGIFITPGYEFRVVGGLLTNFHLPKTTLMMLVGAFSGLARIKAAYAHATQQEYRFFSYGDACFLER